MDSDRSGDSVYVPLSRDSLLSSTTLLLTRTDTTEQSAVRCWQDTSTQGATRTGVEPANGGRGGGSTSRLGSRRGASVRRLGTVRDCGGNPVRLPSDQQVGVHAAVDPLHLDMVSVLELVLIQQNVSSMGGHLQAH